MLLLFLLATNHADALFPNPLKIIIDQLDVAYPIEYHQIKCRIDAITRSAFMDSDQLADKIMSLFHDEFLVPAIQDLLSAPAPVKGKMIQAGDDFFNEKIDDYLIRLTYDSALATEEALKEFVFSTIQAYVKQQIIPQVQATSSRKTNIKKSYSSKRFSLQNEDLEREPWMSRSESTPPSLLFQNDRSEIPCF